MGIQLELTHTDLKLCLVASAQRVSMSEAVASGLRRVWSMKGASWAGDGPEMDTSFARKSLNPRMVSSIRSMRLKCRGSN